MKFKKSISFVLTLCMILSLFATFVIPVAADGSATIVPTTLNSYGWAADTEILLSTMSDSSKTVVDALGGEWFQWWTHVVADWSEADGAFVVTATQTNVTDYVTTNLGEGRIVLSAWGDNATESANNLRALAVGDKLVLDGDFSALVDGTGAISGYTFTVVPAAPELPEDATGLDVYGYTHTFLNYVMYVDADMTLGELTAKYYGSAKDLNYFKVIVVNEDGTVAATYLDLDRNTNPASVKTDIAVTAGQVVLALSANEANVGRHEVADTVNVGDVVTFHNVDFNAEPGELSGAGFTVEAAPAANEVVINVNEKDVLTDGKTGFDGDWGAVGTSDVLLLQNTKCSESAMDVVLEYDLGETKVVKGVVIDFYHCAGVMIGYPEGEILVEYSVDGENYDLVDGMFEAEPADVAVGSYGTVSTVCNFYEAVEAAYIRISFTAGSSTGVLGDTPADNKIFWEFVAVAEVTVVESNEVVINVNEKDVLTDGKTGFDGDWGAVGTSDVLLLQNGKCTTLPMDVVLEYDLGTSKFINGVVIDFYHCAGVMIGYPEGQIIVEASGNPDFYSTVGKFDIASADVAVGSYGTVSTVCGFDTIEAQYIRITFTAGSSTGVLGDTPADNKIFWEFAAVAEVAVTEPSEAPFEDGDNVVITYPKDNLAISAEEDVYNNKYRLAGTDVANGAVFTVDITDDGIYFICNGKYLTSGATGNNLTLEDEASEYSLWAIEEAENGWYIKNVNAAYNGNAQYIEYYYAFTTYGFNASNPAIYTFQFIVQEAPALDEVDGGELPAHNPRAGSLSIAANTAITYTVAFEHGANFNLWSEDVTVLVNGEALEMGMLGYVATLAKGDKVTIVNAGVAAVEIYPSIAPVIPGTMSSPIVLDELGDITANVTEDIVMDNGAVFYLYTATANGTLTITMPEGNWTYTVNNLTAGIYGDTQWSDSEDSSATTSIEVSAGDEIQIIVGTYNPDEPWTAPVGELTFNAAFEANVVVSQVVENFNHADWNTGINTFHAAYIFTDAEIYAGVGMAWWYHASFAPTANGGYVVVEVAAPGSDAATNNTLAIPEGGFVWVAWTSSEEGYGASSGAYAKAIMSGLKAGDIVLFNGLDIANCTTTADATATVLAPAADMDLLVSHNYNYSWHCFETQIISGLVPDAPKTAGDAPFLKDSVLDADILYIVENVGGAYLVTGIVSGAAIPATAIPEGGFLYYVTSNCTGYDAICHGELIGKYLLLGDIDLSTTFAIDPSKDPAYTMKAVSGFGNGDVNLNGEIDATDYAILRKLVLGTITAEDLGDVAYGVADVNGDGKVNARDYYLVKRAFLAEDNSILGWEVKEDDAE